MSSRLLAVDFDIGAVSVHSTCSSGTSLGLVRDSQSSTRRGARDLLSRFMGYCQRQLFFRADLLDCFAQLLECS